VAGAFAAGSIEDRFLRFLATRYPATTEEAAVALGLRQAEVDFLARRFAAAGLVTVEEVAGRRWVALSGKAFQILGATPPEAHAARERRRAGAAPPRDPDDPAFG
jgi:DNA-binding transcriptional ArsR family regulator